MNTKNIIKKILIIPLFFICLFFGIDGLSADNSDFEPNVFSRSEWSANESYMTWAPEYSEVKAIVIHHTAGEEKTVINQMDAMRNLYYGHAVLYRWGDVGYNYVVDINGAVYEGRYGGNSVIGGHVLGYNPGTIGVSVIGDYNIRNIETYQYDALIDLLTYLCYQNHLDPKAEVYLKNKTIPVISGHRDLNPTSCPGNTLYGRMGDIRTKVAEKLETYPPYDYQAQFMSADSNVLVYGGESTKAKAKIKNTGNSFWLSESSQKISLKNNDSDLEVNLVNFGRSIEPGEIVEIDIEIEAPLVNKSQRYNFELIQDGNVIPGSQFSMNIEMRTPPYKAQIIDSSDTQIIRPGKQATVWVDIKNMGTNDWSGSEGLELAKENGKDSSFYREGDWIDKKTPMVFENIDINSGDKKRFSFGIKAPEDPGQYKESFILKSNKFDFEGGEDLVVDYYFMVGENEEELGDIGQKIYSTNSADYDYEVVKQSDYVNMLPGETRDMFIEVKNTGNSNWYGDILKLATSREKNRTSVFADSTWDKPNRVEMNQYRVETGETARFDFSVTAPQSLGEYNEYFNFIAEDIGWLKDIGVFWQITVSPPTYAAEIVEQSSYINTSYGMPAILTARFKNTGNITWDKNIVHLGGYGPMDRNSIFSSDDWLSSNRVNFLENEVKPGETATFSFNLNTNQGDGRYKEAFRLVADGYKWFGEKGLFWIVNINPLFDDFEYVDQSSYLTLSPGEQTQIWLKVKNSGTSKWQKSGNIPVRLATSNPKDRMSRFIDSNRVLLDQEEINPGETGKFTFNITAPNTPGVYEEYFTLVRDGKTWFRDIGIYWMITVEDNQYPTDDNLDEGQIENEHDITLSSSGSFIVVNSSETKIAEGDSGDVVSANYENGKYVFSVGGNNYTSDSHIRFVPWSPTTFFEITSYEDRPAWNTSLNDNKFKGVIEIRKSKDSSKLWVINELNIEDYLRGVSESLDSFDSEYLKAAAVAQRSYVYHHWSNGGRHPDDFLTLKNSRNGNGDDQIYQGYNFTLRASNVSVAVEATAGEVVTYDGEPVITPYFNQSDGRTRSASEAWGWDSPYLVSKDDPYCEGLELKGHGVGMSGVGARGLVSEGRTYSEVLNYYYTNTGIGEIDTNINVRIGIYSVGL